MMHHQLNSMQHSCARCAWPCVGVRMAIPYANTEGNKSRFVRCQLTQAMPSMVHLEQGNLVL
eukprot:scaffold121684_cov24-Tisochrysis_lutea.AAC.1